MKRLRNTFARRTRLSLAIGSTLLLAACGADEQAAAPAVAAPLASVAAAPAVPKLGILQLNDLTLAFIGSAVDVACHEGYPGHHAQFVLFETAAGQQGPGVEDTLVLLRSPEAALREGAANLGVGLVFPFAERLQFEQEVLFPLAGLPPEQAETNLRIGLLLEELAAVTLPIIRDYRDGVATYNASTFELEREALVSSPAELLRFVDDYGAYSVGYTLMRLRLQAQLDKDGQDPWATLAVLLQQPSVLP